MNEEPSSASGETVWIDAPIVAVAAEPSPDAGRGPDAIRPAGGGVEGSLKSAVGNARGRLGNLAPWQKQVFEQEVMNDYSIFVRDYKRQGEGVSVQVDLQSIQRYLSFYAPTRLGGGKPVPILIGLRAETGCGKCTDALPSLKRLLQARLESRGWTPTWATEAEIVTAPGIPLDTLKGASFEDRLRSLATARGLKASSTAQLEAVRAPIEDTAHAGEVHYQLRYGLDVPELSLRSSNSLEFGARDSFDEGMRKLMAQAWIGAGSGAGTSGTAILTALIDEKPELSLSFKGIRRAQQVAILKQELANRLRAGATLEQRSVSRGHVTFALKTDETPESVRAELARIKLDSLSWEIRGLTAADANQGPRIEVELR